MDVRFFSNLRINFIRMYYREGRKPFDGIQTAIDNEEAPYDKPPRGYDIESGEPAYLTEWLEAEMAINVLGYSCLSMLSNSLKIFFQNLESVFRFKASDKKVFKQGFVGGYKVMLSKSLTLTGLTAPPISGLSSKSFSLET